MRDAAIRTGLRVAAHLPLAVKPDPIILWLAKAISGARAGKVSGDFMKLTRLCFLAVMLAVLGACATPSGPVRPAKSPDAVILTEDDITDRPYEVLSDIEVTVSKPNVFADDPTQAMVATALKKKAAEMGADAVVLARYGALGMGLFNWGEIHGRGRAVVFKQP